MYVSPNSPSLVPLGGSNSHFIAISQHFPQIHTISLIFKCYNIPPPPHCLPQAAMVTLSLCDNVSSIFFPPFNFLHYLGVKVRERILRNSEMPKVPSLRICVLFCMYNTYHTIHAYLQQNPVHHYQKRATPRLGTVTPSSPLFLSPSTNGVPEHTLSGWYISSAVPPVQ